MKYESYYCLVKHLYSQSYFSVLHVIRSIIGIVFILDVFVILTVIPITLHNNMNTNTCNYSHSLSLSYLLLVVTFLYNLSFLSYE